MRNATLLFPIRRSKGQIAEICLAMKKRGFGMGRWNGAGGKVAAGETVEEGARRETIEEISIIPHDMEKVAELAFTFPEKPEWDQVVHAYFCEEWQGDPKESEEMAPKWFSVSDIPYPQMWPDDIFWLPLALDGKLIEARFVFGEKDAILEQSVKVVKSLKA